MISHETVHELGKILNYTFGKSSTSEGTKAYAEFNGRGMSAHIIEEGKLKVSFVTIVNLPMHPDPKLQERLSDESITLTGKMIDDLKKKFREETGKSLRLKEENSVDSIELIGLNQYSPVKRAYYRRNTVYTIND